MKDEVENGCDRKNTDENPLLNLDSLRAERHISGGVGSSVDEQMISTVPVHSKLYRSESVSNEDFRIPFTSRHQSLRTGRMMRSESLYVPPKISDSLIVKTTKRIHKGIAASNFDHS